MSVHADSMWGTLVALALVLLLALGVDTARAHSASSAVGSLVAHDANVLVGRLRHDWQQGSTHWKIAKAPYGCCEVYDLARSGRYAHGVYILQSQFDGSRVASLRLMEMVTQRGYRPGDAGSLLYRFSLQAIGKGNWLIELEYFNHASIAYTTAIGPPHSQDGELTASELQTLYEQVLSVFSKAEHHAPVSEEPFLHPGLASSFVFHGIATNQTHEHSLRAALLRKSASAVQDEAATVSHTPQWLRKHCPISEFVNPGGGKPFAQRDGLFIHGKETPIIEDGIEKATVRYTWHLSSQDEFCGIVGGWPGPPRPKLLTLVPTSQTAHGGTYIDKSIQSLTGSHLEEFFVYVRRRG
jgi:hypothetical protein